MRTIDKASRLNNGQAMWVRSSGSWAVYLRRLDDGSYVVSTGWATSESYDRDYLSESPVPGLEGICHEAWEREFGNNLIAAAGCYDRCVALGKRRQPIRDAA